MAMLFAVILKDKPDHGALRADQLQAHIQWVDQHKDIVLVAGSLRERPQDVPRGGLWIVEAESKESVLELMKTDPFYVCGLRQQVDVLHWSKALQHHKAWV